jgi:hypothetical protein
MLDIILILAAIAVLIFVIVAAMQPSDFRVTRTITITAPASAVFAQVNDSQKWDAWSPWAKLDPEARNSFEGPASGTGAIMSCDKMVGGQFEKGLAALKSLVEATS